MSLPLVCDAATRTVYEQVTKGENIMQVYNALVCGSFIVYAPYMIVPSITVLQLSYLISAGDWAPSLWRVQGTGIYGLGVRLSPTRTSVRKMMTGLNIMEYRHYQNYNMHFRNNDQIITVRNVEQFRIYEHVKTMAMNLFNV